MLKAKKIYTEEVTVVVGGKKCVREVEMKVYPAYVEGMIGTMGYRWEPKKYDLPCVWGVKDTNKCRSLAKLFLEQLKADIKAGKVIGYVPEAKAPVAVEEKKEVKVPSVNKEVSGVKDDEVVIDNKDYDYVVYGKAATHNEVATTKESIPVDGVVEIEASGVNYDALIFGK